MISARTLFLLAFLGLPTAGATGLQETWQTGYEGKDATGAHVLGYWKFTSGAELRDSSGKGHDLTLSGAATGVEGHSGGGLKCGYSPTSSHSARASGGGLSPSGPFTLEMWVKPDPGGSPAACHLVDKRYTPDNHTDYAWKLMDAEKSGLRRMSLALGFGSTSETFHSEPMELKTDGWQHLAVTYDAKGTVTFYRDGSLVSQSTRPGLGAVKPGPKNLHIGDRVGSTFSGFPGTVDEVRLSEGALRFESIGLQIRSTRHVWERMEKAEPIVVTCTNLQRKTITGARLTIILGEKIQTLEIPPLEPGKSHDFPIPVDTTLKPAAYTLAARLESGGTTVEKKTPLEIVPRPAPAMPVILWGGGDIPRMKDAGFTHYMALGVDNMGDIWKSRRDPAAVLPAGMPDTIGRNMTLLDDALAAGIRVIARVSPRGYAETLPGMLRVGRDGKPLARKDIIALNPELPPFFEKVGRSLGTTYGGHPAFSATLVNTEVRDASQPSFSPLEVDAYRAFSGRDIPAEVQSRGGVDWQTLADFPTDRVIPDDHPILSYYRWFWTMGDGWNALHSALSDGVKATARPGHWTFHDPAVRQPAISGAGGSVDVLSHWTYTYPDPQRIGLATDQILAMSEASGKGQQVMKMTQLIWYRSQTAPVTKTAPDDPVPWVDQDPDAAYITIAPMHLREAFWTKLSRPVSGIMYHGWQSLVPTESASAYKFTNPNTVHVLRELLHDVVRPLGPTLMAVPDERAEVAFLESFTAQMFSKRGGYGYNNGWPADVWLALQHAHVRTDILHESTLLKDGLDGRRFLVMPHCDVLTASVAERIRQWQAQGGKIIADEHLCPALKADVLLPAYKRTRNAAADRTGLLAMAGELSSRMTASGHVPAVTADTPDAILRMRRSGDARYLFVINDSREAGNYVGQNGLVLENGLPTQTVVTLPQDAGAVYDLTRGRQLQPQRSEGGAPQLPVDLGPCDGRIFMILPAPLQSVTADLPDSIKRGETAELRVRITTGNDQPVKAVIPLEVRIRDTNGKEAEGSGYHAAKDGTLVLPLSIATNEDPGSWEIRIKELASGMETTRHTKVRP
ncbi:MAG: LamG domain-containing protein [Akkermansiaceae bacterium]|nr:LamG domain-containing protein [Akkermansiaceae bacterium]